MLTLTPAPSGNGLVLRDSSTRLEILIGHDDLLTIGTSLLNAHATQQPPPRQRPRKGLHQ
jgi:hypothetical protein